MQGVYIFSIRGLFIKRMLRIQKSIKNKHGKYMFQPATLENMRVRVIDDMLRKAGLRSLTKDANA